jgi:hypothetical protein
VTVTFGRFLNESAAFASSSGQHHQHRALDPHVPEQLFGLLGGGLSKESESTT